MHTVNGSTFLHSLFFFFFFFNDTATTEIYTLSLHDALPIFCAWRSAARVSAVSPDWLMVTTRVLGWGRSEEHTSELQSRLHLVCRLLLEKKKKQQHQVSTIVRHSGVVIDQSTMLYK